jgi:hypothetical protein
MPPAQQNLTVRHLPEIRAELVAWLTDPTDLGGPATWAKGFPPDIAEREHTAARMWATSMRAAELFYVSAGMARLAASAGLALPSYRLHPEDLPAEHGVLLWEEAVTEGEHGGESTGAPIIGATWAVRGNAVDVRTWARREDWITHMAEGDPRAGLRDLTPAEVRNLRTQYPQPITSMAQSRLPFGQVPGWLANPPQDPESMSLYELEDHDRTSSRIEKAERALVVTWLLMGQTLATTEDIHPTKASMKFIRRIDPGLLGATRYVQLRHQSMSPQARSDTAEAGRTYRHRWIVRGHWRNQYYPSRRANRPIWIDAHPKGPDGAPILDPDKLVNILRR